MEPTLDVGQRVLVNRFIYHFEDPSIGDIVVFHPPEGRRRRSRRRMRRTDARQTAAKACAKAVAIGVERKLHQAPGRRPRRHGQDHPRHRDRQRQGQRSRQRAHPAAGLRKAAAAAGVERGAGRRRLQFPQTDQDSTRSLLHDGRQPCQQQGQPILGARSPAPGSSARPSPPTGRRTGSASSKAHQRRLARSRRLFDFDRGLGSRLVAGADEAGRGCLAGPLVAAAVLIDYEALSHADRRALAGLHDSKQMTAEKREELFPAVLRAAARASVVVRSAGGDRPARAARDQHRSALLCA